MWKTATGECKRTLEGHTSWISSLVALGDGRVVSAGSVDKTLRVWNAATGECERTLEGHTDLVVSLVALGDGRVVSWSWDTTLRVWNAITGECERTLEGHTGQVSSLVALGDGRVVSGSLDTTLRVWNVATGECSLCFPKRSAEAVALLALPRLQHALAALTSHELSAVGSCLVGPGFARTYVDAVVEGNEFVCMLALTSAADLQAARHEVVACCTANGAVHFFSVVR
jgi:WD40 repeat protein